MRKNAVNRQLTLLPGGVCAVAGFTANTTCCGFSPNQPGDDVGLILSDKKCAVAFMGNATKMAGAPVKVSRKHTKSGYARGVLFNSKIANVYGAQSERLCKLMCWEVAKRLRIDSTDFVIASTGKIGDELALETFAKGVPNLLSAMDFVEEKDKALATVLDEKHPKQLAFSFELGDFICKIGAVFKGNKRVAPNFATTLCFMTTDVNISPEMLQKALNNVANDTFNQLSVDGISSPNDCVCLLANGKAGNYKITEEDTEYKKFTFALSEALDRVCKTIVANPLENEQAFICKVQGTRSKKTARELAKAMVQAVGIRDRLSNGELNVQDILCMVAQTGEGLCLDNLQIRIVSSNGAITIVEENKRLPVLKETIKNVTIGEDFCVEIGFGQGNYSATAYGQKTRRV